MNSDKQVTIFINDQPYQAAEGEAVLKVAIRYKLNIPHLCFHEDLPVEANCRLCLVEVADQDKKTLTTSCTLQACEGLRLTTHTKQIEKLRHTNLQLLLARHSDLCPKCQKNLACPAKKLIEEYQIEQVTEQVKEWPVHQMGTAAEFDPQMCIKCGKCVNVCSQIGINFLELEGKGADMHLTHSKNPKVDCVYCGQCTIHCPVSAVREQSQLEEVESVLADPDKILIAQMAPSVRASLGEEFGLEAGTNVEGQAYTALRQLGFTHIFDVNMGADITTMVEAQELVERLQARAAGETTHLPMFTSCCPAWVKFVEFYAPELIPHLTTSRSPQIHSGAAYKTWWASTQNIDPSRIVVVSLMPCTSKKYEASLEKLEIDFQGHKLKPVDLVLTTRELGALLKKRGIDLLSLATSQADSLGQYSGAGAIYGASGGVMESALRSAAYMLNKEDLPKLELEEVRGMKGIKRASVQIGDLTLKVAVVATPMNARKVLAELKRDPQAYDYIEFMACPGGCIGGGGQPLGGTAAAIKQRTQALYRIDQEAPLRTAHSNPVVQEFLAWLQDKPQLQQQVLHTSYSPKDKFA